MEQVVMRTELLDIGVPLRGKVRDIYNLGDHLLLVATDRLSAFDVVLPDGIPGKGSVLTQLTRYWFLQTEDIVKNHLVSTEVRDFPRYLRSSGRDLGGIMRDHADELRGRSMLVKKAAPLPVECIVRGYLSGSAWKEYCETKSIGGTPGKKLLRESSVLDETIFTPTTKARDGHDIPIDFERMKEIVGADTAMRIRDISIALYVEARDKALQKGIIITDTKFEFGLLDGELILIDELLTPDSSRFWALTDYAPGRGQDSYDKQIVRDHLDGLAWDKTPPGPRLPAEVIARTAKRYREILSILTA
ncbi:MAG: phosphoribosylaminoimidazolesuccinocarboxamide synthase [Nitrospirota bacterium]